MARIRSVKPDFFRHEVLQDLEIANPGSYPMMVFAGLWGHCDSKGRFEWRPRQLKLDILPFLPFDMAGTLEILERAGMVKRYSVDGKEYGEVPTFEKHQRLSGKEATEGEKHPDPIREAMGKQRGSGREIPESQEGKGREEEGKGVNQPPEKPAAFNSRAELISRGVSEPVADDFLKVRKAKRSALTLTAIDGLVAESGRAGITLDAALRECCSRGWQGFKAEWIENGKGVANGKNGSSRADRVSATIAELTGANRHPSPAIAGVAERVD